MCLPLNYFESVKEVTQNSPNEPRKLNYAQQELRIVAQLRGLERIVDPIPPAVSQAATLDGPGYIC
jgi:hypothetical protein